MLRRGALLAAVLVPVLTRGGYLPASRVLFVCLAGIALLAVLADDPTGAGRLARSPVVLLLLALAGLGGLSALWSIGSVADALRWAAVACGYAAVAVAGGAEVLRARTAVPLAIGLAAVAGVAALPGLYAVATFTEPFADRIAGTWRAGGTLEYPPALGLLQVSALPVLLLGMTRTEGRAASALAAALASVAGIALALTASRAQAVLAACVLVAAITWPAGTVGASRTRVAGACGLVAIAALAAALLADGEATARASSELGRVLRLSGIVVIGAAAWHVLSRRDPPAAMRRPASWSVAGVAAVAVLAAALAVPPSPGSTDFTHGRVDLWADALRAVGDRPLHGAGADAFFVATQRYQDQETLARFGHALPLELFVELGVAGLILGLALYAAVVQVLWRARRNQALWLLGPAVAAYLATNLIDWPWHLAGSGAVWAAALGGLTGALRGR